MTISFDAARHAEMIDVIARAAASLEEVFAQLDTEVAVLRADWSGTAQDAYTRAQGEWSDSLRSLQAALSAAAGSARTAGETLTQAHRDATALWE